MALKSERYPQPRNSKNSIQCRTGREDARWDCDGKILPVLRELPAIGRSAGCGVPVEAFVFDQVARMLRDPTTREVRRGPYNRQSQLVSDGHRDHVPVDDLTQLNPCIEPFSNDVDRRLADHDVELHVRVLRQETREQRLPDYGSGDARHINAQCAARCLAKLPHCCYAGPHLVQTSAHGSIQTFPGLREANAARTALDERNAKPLFEPPDAVADRRVTQSEALPRGPEALGLSHSEKRCHAVEFIRHWKHNRPERSDLAS